MKQAISAGFKGEPDNELKKLEARLVLYIDEGWESICDDDKELSKDDKREYISGIDERIEEIKDYKPKEGLIARMLKNYDPKEKADKLESMRRSIMRTLEGPWKSLIKNIHHISEEDKKKYLESFSEGMKKLEENLDEKNKLVEEYAELKKEYTTITEDSKKLRERLTKETKKEDLERQMHDLGVAGGKLEGVMFKKSAIIDQYKIMTECCSKARTMLGGQKTKLSKQIEWLSTAIVQLDQMVREQDYITPPNRSEIELYPKDEAKTLGQYLETPFKNLNKSECLKSKYMGESTKNLKEAVEQCAERSRRKSPFIKKAEVLKDVLQGYIVEEDVCTKQEIDSLIGELYVMVGFER